MTSPLAQIVADWGPDATPGRRARLDYLCDRLGLDPIRVGHLRYQLLHRTVAAMIEADRFGAAYAMMLVHSFDPARARFADYSALRRSANSSPEPIGPTCRHTSESPVQTRIALAGSSIGSLVDSKRP